MGLLSDPVRRRALARIVLRLNTPLWISLCSPGCPGTYSVDQTSLELRSACTCLCPLNAGINSVCCHCPALAPGS
uniref:GPI anchor attachment protein 1 n=1 Tax=Mus musculus TaxID=10090 RepID=E9Q4I5_MOUSE